MSRIVVVGSGASVIRSDLELIQRFDTIAFNRSYIIFDEWAFRPTYFASFDPMAIESISGDLKERVVPSVKKQIFLNSIVQSRLPEDNKFHFVNISTSISPQFSLNSISDCYTVGASSLQVLGALGYKKILLIGVDANYSSSGANYFRDDYSSMNKGKIEFKLEKMFEGWENVATLCKREGVEVINSSRASLLDCFDRCSLEEGVRWLEA